MQSLKQNSIYDTYTQTAGWEVEGTCASRFNANLVQSMGGNAFRLSQNHLNIGETQFS